MWVSWIVLEMRKVRMGMLAATVAAAAERIHMIFSRCKCIYSEEAFLCVYTHRRTHGQE